MTAHFASRPALRRASSTLRWNRVCAPPPERCGRDPISGGRGCYFARHPEPFGSYKNSKAAVGSITKLTRLFRHPPGSRRHEWVPSADIATRTLACNREVLHEVRLFSRAAPLTYGPKPADKLDMFARHRPARASRRSHFSRGWWGSPICRILDRMNCTRKAGQS